MSLSIGSKIIAVGLMSAALAATASEASAGAKYPLRRGYAQHHHYRGGYGPGPAIAGAALGIMGAAAAGIAADRYYNGYPVYSYGPRYGGCYGYDYVPDHGYYGPY